MTAAARLIRSRAIKAGDTIGIIAPGSGFQKKLLKDSARWLKNRGYRVQYREDIFEKEDYLAGSDERRLAEWQEAWEDPRVKAIFCARGGYGALRLLEKAGSDLLPHSSKLLMGYSDITVLLNWVAWKKGFPTIHGPLMAAESFLSLSGRSRDRNFRLLETSQTQKLKTPKEFQVASRKAFRGTLWGGNLTMMASVLGTPFFPDVEGGVLFLEEVREPRYRLDRLFAQLALGGVFEKIRGLILGDLIDENGRAHSPSFVQNLLKRYIDLKRKGVLVGLKAGHKRQEIWLPIGGKVEFDPLSRTLEIGAFVLDR